MTRTETIQITARREAREEEWKDLQPRFRRAVAAARKKGDTLHDIAMRIRCSRQHIYNMMANRNPPKIETIYVAVKAFTVEIEFETFQSA